MAREKEVEENGQGRKLNKEEAEEAESRKNSTTYLTMPSYAEVHKKEINKYCRMKKQNYAVIKRLRRFLKMLISTLLFPTAKTLKKTRCQHKTVKIN